MSTKQNEYKLPPVYELWEGANADAQLRHEFVATNNYFNKLRIVGNYWKRNEPKILEIGNRNKCAFYNADAFPWEEVFSPIEYDAWVSIRGKGIPLYPQYPVLKYYVDFGNPVLKVAIELDGAAYHNTEKDHKRDVALLHEGWKVFRIPGSEMIKPSKDFTEFEQWEWDEDYDAAWEHIRHWIINTGDGVIEAVRTVYWQAIPKSKSLHRFYSLCVESLEKHCLV
jgi:very-short-patch-repair endonuclease